MSITITNDLKTFADFKAVSIARIKGDPTDQKTIDFFEEALNTRNRMICSKKKWKFLRVLDRSIQLPIKYTTGTISVTQGTRTITGSGTTWGSSHVGWWIKPTGIDTSYRVVAVSSATSIKISSNFSESSISSGGYTLYQSELALPPNCEDLGDVRIDGKPWEIKPKGPSLISHYRQINPSREGAPKIYSIEGRATWAGTNFGDWIMGFDFFGSSTTKAVSFYPHIPDDNYTIHIPYKKMVTTMINDSDESDIPIEHRHVLLLYVLADWHMKNGQDSTGKYYEALAKSELNELKSKYLDTDDILTFYPESSQQYSKRFLRRHSSYFFDRGV